MREVSVVFLTIGVLALLEGIFFILWPTQTREKVLHMIKSPQKMRKAGMVEILIALVCLILSVVFR